VVRAKNCCSTCLRWYRWTLSLGSCPAVLGVAFLQRGRVEKEGQMSD
jgi:hypothetical protein